jgi:nitric oxide reductase NorQ protein
VVSQSTTKKTTNEPLPLMDPSDIKTHEDIVKFIKGCYQLKPDKIIISETKWKYLIRAALRGRNIMMTGSAGCGKTVIAMSIPQVLKRPFFRFNLGQTGDPKSYLIGNTHASKDRGTYFDESEFVRAIKTENAVIMLDELSRAHPDAWNILMPVLDLNQHYLRLDESSSNGTPVDIQVAPGVCFIATANIGSEYTATRIIDKAMTDRFSIVEVDVLNESQEFSLLKKLFPNVPEPMLKAIAGTAHDTRMEVQKPTPELHTIISTRMSVETADLINDGFSLQDAAEVAIYPFFPQESNERQLIKALFQKRMTIDATTADDNENLFTDDDFKNAVL